MCTAKSILFCVVISIGGFELSNACPTRLNNSISENEENKQEENFILQPKQKKSVLKNKNQTADAVIWFSCYSNR